MSEQEKKQRRIYDWLNAEIKPKVSLSTVYKAKNFFYRKKKLFKEKEGLNKKKRNEGFFCTCNGD